MPGMTPAYSSTRATLPGPTPYGRTATSTWSAAGRRRALIRTVSSDDISAIVAFGSNIGLMWSNQYDESGRSGYYFAIHHDGESDDTWREDNPVMGAGMANDHINLKADSEGRVFATLKTRRDRIDRNLDAPYSMLWVRDQDGSWTSHVFGTVGDSLTRSLALIDEEQRLLYMFASSPTCTGGKIF